MRIMAPVFFLSFLAGKFDQFAQSFPCQFCYQKHLKEYPLELKTNMTGNKECVWFGEWKIDTNSSINLLIKVWTSSCYSSGFNQAWSNSLFPLACHVGFNNKTFFYGT